MDQRTGRYQQLRDHRSQIRYSQVYRVIRHHYDHDDDDYVYDYYINHVYDYDCSWGDDYDYYCSWGESVGDYRCR